MTLYKKHNRQVDKSSLLKHFPYDVYNVWYNICIPHTPWKFQKKLKNNISIDREKQLEQLSSK